MVECNLAKVEAEGSNPFFRFFEYIKNALYIEQLLKESL